MKINKILIILTLFLLISLSFFSVVLGASFDDDMYYPDGMKPVGIDSDAGQEFTNRVLLYDENSSTYYLYCITCYNGTHDTQKLYLMSDNMITGSYIHHNLLFSWNGSGWANVDWISGDNLANNVSNTLTSIVKNCSIISTSSDIYTDSSCSEIFFQNPPQGITETLVEETMKAQIMEQMKTMIVGFLKYLIVLVISLIAFWKGWQFLSTQLRKA